MKIDLKHELATLTTVNELAINRLLNKATWCMSDAVEAALLSDEDTIEFDLGFGSVIVKLNDDNVVYKFKPSKHLDKAIIDTIISGKNELVLNLESNLANKISSLYKDMF